jgi:hypothetical protein
VVESMQNDKKWWKMMKKWKNEKNDKNMKKNSNIAIFYLSENFCTTGSKNDETW